MSAQLSYSINQAAAYAGGLYSLAPADLVSRAVETVAGVGFGLAVSRGTDKSSQVTLGGTDFLGVSVRDLGREGAVNTGAIQYNENDAAAIMRSGYVWANCVSGCTAGNAVKYVQATGALDAGAPGAGETAITGATWETTAAAGALAVLRLA